jgi:hypothetical protein
MGVWANGTAAVQVGKIGMGATTLAQAILPKGFDMSTPHQLNLTVSVDGTVVGQVDATPMKAKTNPGQGMAALMSGWHVAEFGSFEMKATL